MPHTVCKTCWMGKCPSPRPLFYPLTGQVRFKTIRYTYQMVFFKLKLDKGTAYLHSKVSLTSYCPFFVSHSVMNTIHCPLNCVTFSLRSRSMNGQIPQLPPLDIKFPTPTAVLKSNALLPGKESGGGGGWGWGGVEVTN